MAIQTEVTLQKDYVLSACEGENSQCIAEIVILSTAQRTPVVKSSTIILVVLKKIVRKVPPLDAKDP